MVPGNLHNNPVALVPCYRDRIGSPRDCVSVSYCLGYHPKTQWPNTTRIYYFSWFCELASYDLSWGHLCDLFQLSSWLGLECPRWPCSHDQGLGLPPWGRPLHSLSSRLSFCTWQPASKRVNAEDARPRTGTALLTQHPAVQSKSQAGQTQQEGQQVASPQLFFFCNSFIEI